MNPENVRGLITRLKIFLQIIHRIDGRSILSVFLSFQDPAPVGE